MKIIICISRLWILMQNHSISFLVAFNRIPLPRESTTRGTRNGGDRGRDTVKTCILKTPGSVTTRSSGHAITYLWETPPRFHKVSRKSKLDPRKKGGFERETIQGVCRLGDTGVPRVVKPLEIHPRESNPCSLHRRSPRCSSIRARRPP